MSFEIYKLGEVLDASTSKESQDGIVALLEKGSDVVIDLTTCTYVSSAGLRTLLYSYKVAKTKGQNLYLVGVSDEVREVMAMTGFEKFFKYYATIEECKKDIE